MPSTNALVAIIFLLEKTRTQQRKRQTLASTNHLGQAWQSRDSFAVRPGGIRHQGREPIQSNHPSLKRLTTSLKPLSAHRNTIKGEPQSGSLESEHASCARCAQGSPEFPRGGWASQPARAWLRLLIRSTAGFGLAHTDLAAHPLNVLQIVDGGLFVGLITHVHETETTLSACLAIQG